MTPPMDPPMTPPIGPADASGLALMADKPSTSLRLRLRRVARTPIRSVQPDMLVKIRGRLLLRGRALVAPITQTACALYCLDAVDTATSLHLGSEDLPDDWSGPRLPRELRGLDLLLDDGTARALVQIQGAQLSLLGSWMTSSPATRSRFLLSRGQAAMPLSAASARAHEPSRFLEYRELKLVPGELVTVFGCARYGADPDPQPPSRQAYRAPGHRCVFAATPAVPLYVIQERVAALDAIA